MELRHLKLIEAVTEEGTLSKAGERLYLTQSALSHQLKELEMELGTNLFHRINKRLVINEAGKILLESARKILKEVEVAQKSVEKHINGGHGEVRLSTECYTCYHWLPRVLKRFNRDFPHVDVHIFPEFTRNPMEGLLKGKVDFIITSNHEKNNDVVYKELFRDQQVAVVPKGHPWEKKAYVTAKDFANENVIIYTGPIESVELFRSLLIPANVTPRKILEIELTEATIEMVKAGYGIKVMATWAIKQYLDDHELTIVPVTKRGLFRTWYAASLKNKEWLGYYDQFIDILVKNLRGVE